MLQNLRGNHSEDSKVCPCQESIVMACTGWNHGMDENNSTALTCRPGSTSFTIASDGPQAHNALGLSSEPLRTDGALKFKIQNSKTITNENYIYIVLNLDEIRN